MTQVLIIDDSRLAGMVVERILAEKNITATSSQTAADVFGLEGKTSCLRENRPEIILLDIIMPDMSGLDILLKLKSMKDQKDIPVIMVSASSSESNVLEALNRGAAGFLSKPIVPGKLLRELAKAAAAIGSGDLIRKLSEYLDLGRQPEHHHGELIVGPADLNYLLEILDGDTDMMYQLVQVFVEDMPVQIEGMRKALAAGDARGFGSGAHIFQGSVGNIGANLLTLKATKLAKLGSGGELEKAQHLFVELENDSDILYTALQTWLKQT